MAAAFDPQDSRGYSREDPREDDREGHRRASGAGRDTERDPETDRDTVSIECASCIARHTDACDDCLVTAVLGPEEDAVRLDEEEQRAVVELQVAGLVPLVRYRRDGAPRHVDHRSRSGHRTTAS